jgi:hypothetical protein
MIHAGSIKLPESLVTAFRVTHRGTAFDLSEEQGTARAVACGLRALHGQYVFSSDLRTALAAYVAAKALSVSAEQATIRIKALCRDLVADVALVRASLPRSFLARASTDDEEIISNLRAQLVELQRVNARLCSALNEALPRAVGT